MYYYTKARWLSGKQIILSLIRMKELKDIVAAFDDALLAGKQTALATVVLVEGSSYRRAGARMLVTEDGQLTGAISGGCLEGDALRKARLVLSRNKSMLVTYDTTDEDDAKFGVGLGCNGIIHILIEPINVGSINNPIALLKQFLSKRNPAVLITCFCLNDKLAEQPGTCLLLTNDGMLTGHFPNESIKEALAADAGYVLIKGNSLTKTYQYSDKFTCFIELLQPDISLIVFGAGNDAIPVTRFASVLGWEITLVDGRPNYAVKARFPLVDNIVIGKPGEVIRDLKIDQRTVAILMSHNYIYDIAALKELLPFEIRYLAALGPKKRLNRMLEEIRSEGIEITQPQLNKLYGPAGLDIGSDDANEIALSIIAEIQSIVNQRPGTSLRNKMLIHNRDEQVIIELPVEAEIVKSCDL